MDTFKKHCPICGKEQIYKSRRGLLSCIKRNTKCRSCNDIGKNNPFFGKHRTEDEKLERSN